MPMITSEKGQREAVSKSRQSGQPIRVKENGTECVVSCDTHGTSVPAPKWSVACEVARNPFDWCPACKEAGPPAPPTREERQAVGAQLHADRERAKAEREARAAAARLESAKNELAEMDEREAKATEAYEAAFDRATKATGDTARSLWNAADRAQDACLRLSARRKHLERVIAETEPLVMADAA